MFSVFLRVSLCAVVSLGLLGVSLSCASQSTGLSTVTGEKITYAIKKLGIKAGEATLVLNGLTEMEGRQLYLITFTAKALNFFDEEKIYLDPKTFYPVVIKRDLNIFGKKEKITEEYFPEENQVKITKMAGGETGEQTINQPGGIDNIYSFIQRYRLNGEFRVGERLEMTLPTKGVKVDLVKETTLKAGGKVYDAYYMRSNPKQYEIWFDAGRNKIPLRIDGGLGKLNASMIMVKYQPGV